MSSIWHKYVVICDSVDSDADSFNFQGIEILASLENSKHILSSRFVKLLPLKRIIFAINLLYVHENAYFLVVHLLEIEGLKFSDIAHTTQTLNIIKYKSAAGGLDNEILTVSLPFAVISSGSKKADIPI